MISSCCVHQNDIASRQIIMVLTLQFATSIIAFDGCSATSIRNNYSTDTEDKLSTDISERVIRSSSWNVIVILQNMHATFGGVTLSSLRLGGGLKGLSEIACLEGHSRWEEDSIC